MATTSAARDDNEVVLEYTAMSGILHVTVDRQMLYSQEFNEHIKLRLVLNKNKGTEEGQNQIQDIIKFEDESTQPEAHAHVHVLYGEEDLDQLDGPSDAENGDDSHQMRIPLAPALSKTEASNNSAEEIESSSSDHVPVNCKSSEVLWKKHSNDKLTETTARKQQGKRKMKSRAIRKESDGIDLNQSKKIRQKVLENKVCSYCSQSFKSNREYMLHQRSERQNFSCQKCGLGFPFQAHLLVHMDNHEKMEALMSKTAHSSNESDQLAELYRPNHSSKQSKRCSICGLVLSSLPHLKSHVMTHTGEQEFKCCVCGRSLSSISSLKQHLIRHSKTKILCKLCNVFFDSRGELAKHQLSHSFPCNLCGKVFANRTGRYFHYKADHKNDILKCPVCSKLYSSKSELEEHVRYHKNTFRNQCPVCGKIVHRLKKHIQRKHYSQSESTEIKDSHLVCDKCPKQFTDRIKLDKHLNSHSRPYECHECSKCFAKSGGLSRHLKTHLPDKPFVCEICGKACNQLGNLKIHMRTHNKRCAVGIMQRSVTSVSQSQELITETTSETTAQNT